MWDFFQNEILGMNWLNKIIKNLLESLGLDTSSRVGNSMLFFLYDTVKIMVLLGILVLLISYIQSYFPPERTKRILEGLHGIRANIIAALLGTVTPFCSCSSIPIFIGFTNAGLPLGVTFSFLISSPMVDLGSLVLLTSIFGGKVALVYVLLGLVIAVAGGTVIEKLHLEHQIRDFNKSDHVPDVPQESLCFKDRVKYAWETAKITVKGVTTYILAGVAIGAVIHNWIPETLIIKNSRKRESFGHSDRCARRDSYVCGYLRHHSRCRGTALERRPVRCCPVLYDGGYDSLPAICNHAEKSSQTKASLDFCSHLYPWYYFCRILFQCIPVSVSIEKNVTLCPK